MGNRRVAQFSSSDEEEEAPRASNSSTNEGSARKSRRRNEPRQTKRRKLQLEDDEDEEVDRESNNGYEDPEEEDPEENPEPILEDAKPIGDVLKVSGKGRWKKNHFSAFEFDNTRFELEDPVLLTPEDGNQKPYVAIIKEITQPSKDGGLMVTGQWFYRPEEAEKKGGGSWQARDTRELFYSFHRDDVPAESVMHKCVVHFVPLNKQLPDRKKFPGFIVQKVYDTEQRKLFKLTDKDYEDTKQDEIDLLVQKTISRLGELPDVELEGIPPLEPEEQTRSRKFLRKRSLQPIDVSREDEGAAKFDQPLRAETPGSSAHFKYYSILADSNVLTRYSNRDKWLDKLLQSVDYLFASIDNVVEDKGVVKSNSANHANGDKHQDAVGVQENRLKSEDQLVWPDSAVQALTALERASYEALSSDPAKYNQKLRQLVFNLKNNAFLARRLLKGDLEPSKILNMSPTELKEGLTAEEIARNQPEEAARIQMTDARCRRCAEKKVGVVDIIQAGHGDRYQLECVACGNTWYASRDEAAMMEIGPPSNVKSVGPAPLATAKFENVEKKKQQQQLVSPRGSSGNETESHMPVLDSQKSFNSKPKPASDGNATPRNTTEKAAVAAGADISKKSTKPVLDSQKSFNSSSSKPGSDGNDTPKTAE